MLRVFIAWVVLSAAIVQASEVLEAPAPRADEAVEKGKALYTKLICVACHSVDGSVRAAPSFKGLYGSKQKLKDGTEIAVDDAYLRESIVNPGARVVAGFQPLMPPFAGKVSDAELDALIAYIRSLR